MENLQVDIRKFSDYLSKNGIKPSFQRLKILERMYIKKDHPTVSQIYEDLIVVIPSLSKTTVYNTINLFLEKGVIKAVNIDTNEARYDIVTKNHGHFICVKCKRIFDFKCTDVDIHKIEEKGNEVISTNITVKGVCKDCLEKK